MQGCIFCEGKKHNVKECRKLLEAELRERAEFIKMKGLCLRCLNPGHMSKDCNSTVNCDQCPYRHHPAAHGVRIASRPAAGASNAEPMSYAAAAARTNATVPTSTPSQGMTASRLAPVSQAFTPRTQAFQAHDQQSAPARASTAVSAQPAVAHTHRNQNNSISNASKSSMILPVYLSHQDKPSIEVLVYCMLDTMSDSSFVLEETIQKLNLPGSDVDLKLSTMHGENVLMQSKRYSGLQVRGANSSKRHSIAKVYSSSVMPMDRSHIPTKELAETWPHLTRIKDELFPLLSCPIGLLLGYDVPHLLYPKQVIAPKSGGPYAQRSLLGWGVVGCTSTTEVESKFFSFRSIAKEVLKPQDVIRVLQADFMHDTEEEAGLSREDKKFVDIMTEGIKRDQDNHCEMPLPVKSKRFKLYNNKSQVERRMSGLQSKFRRDTKYYSEYLDFMNEMISSEYVERVPEEEVNNSECWYIPHFGVYHKVKKKIRIVFDCSAKFGGVSLNDILMQGPNMVNSLLGILCRFRKHPVAFCLDIKKMFYQFRVQPGCRDMLRFLWYPNGDFTKPAISYRMRVHIFGAVSSPACSTFGLRWIAQESGNQEVIDFVNNDFYVDDGLRSTDTAETAVKLIKDSQEIYGEAGIYLHKVISNSKEVLEALPPHDLASSIQDVDLDLEGLPIEKVLGICWNAGSDAFTFRICLKDRPYTRRGILSTVSSIYDPIGFVAPFTIRGKIILQELCRAKLDWDAPIPKHLEEEWWNWCSEIVHLKDVAINRSFGISDAVRPKSVELHHFSDASIKAYGQCSYIRLLDSNGQPHVSFCMGKARVAPLHYTTIPRLELMAAVISTRMAKTLERELKFEHCKHFFYTDSQVVLGYINNDVKRFHVYVANRVQQIHNVSSADQWYHVKGEVNPADDASRGLKASHFSATRWLNGPKFLKKPDLDLHTCPVDLEVNDPEVKVIKCLASALAEVFDIACYDRCSSWTKLLKSVALWQMYIRILHQRITKKHITRSSQPITLTVEDIKRAERKVIQQIQRFNYGSEVQALTSGSGLSKSSSLLKLDCFVDEEGLLRVGGRLGRSSYPWSEIHPVVLPKNSHVTNLLIRHYHEANAHQGRLITLNAIRRAGYWVINGASRVNFYLAKCVTCRKKRSSSCTQKMADLPEDRVEATSPFDCSGVDYFGPFIIKEGRKELKRYGVIFTCLASRAVHLEVAESLSTDSFMNALRRFIAIRGPIRLLRCDQGTNFVGAKGQLESQVDMTAIKDNMIRHGCDFKFKTNPPAASHFGGVWERMIRSTRAILDTLLSQVGDQLNGESLRTFLCEAMAIINSRPLSAMNLNDPTAPAPITPNHLLTMKSEVIVPPPGDFVKEDLYSIKRWRRIQYLANQFWSRWRSEYLNLLQVRRKNMKPKRNLKPGDIVIIVDENVVRNQWKMGKIEEIFMSDDGFVRSAKVFVGHSGGAQGSGKRPNSYVQRPITKLVLLVEAEAHDNEDRGTPPPRSQ